MVLYAEDIMHRDNRVYDPDTDCLTASKIMSDERHGYIIIGKNGKPEGIITEWDLINKVLARNINPEGIKLKDIMSTNLISVSSKTPMDRIADIMAINGIRRLLVIENGKFLGVITSRDILRFFHDYVKDVVDIASKFGIR
ncbi:CBS domain-containing protein [Picrophilus oshimae]|uniref:Inosine-5'-monophosphate dehydrogenase n=1 Tax=Picrophilus torridus (strain ATCC 700027 / DSM 9790 / JCM 10055 / NBRC 100828 / KAW 2/3) TaxID=1122961 RepID=Q6L1M7_PICTO|nr:CBS domain-containing protein [Picrophilus oshimae]AAT43125.1 inosine-5'-monophosphate dehydrogenase [Picrophilus oshimae DSM 9789]